MTTLKLAAYFIVLLFLACPAWAKTNELRNLSPLAPPDAPQETLPPAPLAAPTAADSSLVAKYKEWVDLHAPDTPFDFDELRRFIEANPDWPEMETLIKRAELAIVTSHVDEKDRHEWFAHHPPVTELGKLEASAGKDGVPVALIREAWIEGNFNADREADFLQEYGKLLHVEDHMERASRLTWDNQIAPLRRLWDRLPIPFQYLIKARLDLRANVRRAPYEVAHVPSHYAGDPGLLFDRIVWRERRDDRDGIRELLLIAPENVPYPEKWWPLRERAVREAIEDREYSLARRILSKHGMKDGAKLQDALWLSGWLYLEFQNRPREAYKEFDSLYENAQYPHSKTRAAYWAARAAEKNGNDDIAGTLYGIAAQYPTTFYGQLAWFEINKHAPLKLPENPSISAEDKSSFESNELVQVVRMLAQSGQGDMAKPFILALADRANTAAKAALVAGLGEEIGRTDYAITAAKRAFQNGYLAMRQAYPVPSFFASLPQPSSVLAAAGSKDTGRPQDIEKALLIGLSRQESQFYSGAVSPSGAIGLMQIMPSTAKEIARKSGLPYASSQLYETGYNMQLGSLYLTQLLERFQGSYILSIAAYNAGPGRVNEWVRRFGQPGIHYRGALDWIEKIPYSETRAYVQRVLENTQIYRQLLNSDSGFELATDLER